jgi:hypothetical protein
MMGSAYGHPVPAWINPAPITPSEPSMSANEGDEVDGEPHGGDVGDLRALHVRRIAGGG